MAGGARDCLGSIALPLDQPLTLEQLRVHLGRHADPSIRELTDPSYCFVTETNRELNFHEAAGSLVHKVYPSGAVMLKHTKGEKDGSSQASFTEAWTGTHAGTQGSVTPPVVVSHQGFLLALTFLFFAGDDRAVVDLLRLDLRLLLFPAVAFLALDLLVVALAPLVLERDDRRLLVRLVVLRFAGVVEALFLLRLRAREGSAMEAPSLTPLVDAESIRKNLARPASTFSLSQVWA
ncbi:uncharacterized protein ISCGN_000686 [Ixodes scapularis]